MRGHGIGFPQVRGPADPMRSMGGPGGGPSGGGAGWPHEGVARLIYSSSVKKHSCSQQTRTGRAGQWLKLYPKALISFSRIRRNGDSSRG